MKYTNPKIPEGINVTNEHPLKDFAYLVTIITACIAIITITLSLTIGILVKFIPFDVEETLISKLTISLSDTNNNQANSQEVLYQQQMEDYLQKIANQLSVIQQLPDNFKITVHYLDEPTINAFATLGGHIFIYQGLIKSLNNENALAMVIGHEIAHIKHRHPIIAMARNLSISFVLSLITGFDDSNLVTDISLLTTLAFNRDQETLSDLEAYNSLVTYYGHGLGATDAFKMFKNEEGILTPPELLSTHPLSEDRIEKLTLLAEKSLIDCQKISNDCPLTPFPEFLKDNKFKAH